MQYLIIILLIGCLFSKQVRNSILKFVFGALIVIGIIYLIMTNMSIIIPILIIGFIVSLVWKKIHSVIEKKHDRTDIKLWLEQRCPRFNENMIENALLPYADKFEQSDSNNKKFTSDDIPFGRANAFLNHFARTIYMENPIYYSPIRSKEKIELREYGTILTLGGIYICRQLDTQDSKGNYRCVKYEISFNGMWKIINNESSITIKYQDLHTIEISQENTTIPLNTIYEICQMIIESNISLAITKRLVYTEDQSFQYDNSIDKNFRRNIKNESLNHYIENGGVIGSIPNFEEQYTQVKYNMDGDRGNGYGAEYANNVKDRAFGRRVDYTASHLDDHGRQFKHGADRTVSHINIQTKYYKTASESIGAAFENKQAVYLNSDGSMMSIEVPRDQYQQSLKLMQKRIDSGQVPGAKAGDDPRKYVRKGILTYAQSFNVCKSGSIESLTFDAINGAVCCSSAGGITAVIVFASQIWNGVPPKEAAKSALTASAKVIGKGTIIYMVTMQLSRKEIINPILKKEFTKDGIYKGYASMANPLYKMGDNLAAKISSSEFANSRIGETLKLNKATGRSLISGSVMVAVTFGPDICRALVGRISVKQLVKNTTVGVASIAGGVIGQAVIPIPYIGAILGCNISGFFAKNVLDNFVEDDAVEMFQILKEEFMDMVMLSNLNSLEFNQIIDLTLGNKKLPGWLRDMYACGNYRDFAKNMISGALIEVMKKRCLVSEDMIDNGYLALAV